MQRTTCGGCQSDKLELVLDLGSSPLADDFPHGKDEAFAQPQYPLQLVQCRTCTLVQLTEVVSDDVLWGGDYGFYTGSSWVAVQQQRTYAEDLLARYPEQSRGLVVEIACNDGSMLQRFAEAGCRTLGVDPASGPVAKARESGLNVIHAGFGIEVAEEQVGVGEASLVVANNVIAHVADLDDFIGGIKRILAPRIGVAVIEFQYVGDLITGNQFDHVYHEHRSFFSLSALAIALDRHDLRPLSVQHTTPQGGSLRVHVGRIGISDRSVAKMVQQERWLADEHALAGLQGRADHIKQQMLTMLHELRDDGKRVAGYGASAKSTTLLNFCGIGDDLISYIIDTTPMKHGRYTPGTGIPIISPDADSRSPDVYALFVHNYLPQVLRRETAFRGQWLVPIPKPVLI